MDKLEPTDLPRDSTDVSLAYMRGVVDERQRALEYSNELAERERERTMLTLRVGLERAISDGQTALSNHIEAQIRQLEASLVSAEKLEVQRFDALRTELRMFAESSDKAIAKTETATERRFEAANEWRQQSADRERSQQETLNALTSTLMPREVGDAQFADIRRVLDNLVEKVNKIV